VNEYLEREKVMIVRIVFGLALICSAGAVWAQEPACTFYKVNTSLLNISKEAGGDIYNDALFDGDTTCVTRKANVKGVDWAFIAYKLGSGNVHTPVEGWSALKYLQETSVANAGPPAAPPAAATPAPVAPHAAATPAPVAPAPMAPAPGAAAPAATPTIRPEDVLRFDQPIPFGPFPVNGHSLQEMIDTTPLFSPIEGLDESLWKKKCTSCHQWNQERLCEQGATYVQAPRNVLRVQHPFGGALKIALMRWAKSGCQ
jgi:hypothetical protein